jgi:hypothetical protein
MVGTNLNQVACHTVQIPSRSQRASRHKVPREASALAPSPKAVASLRLRTQRPAVEATRDAVTPNGLVPKDAQGVAGAAARAEVQGRPSQCD